MAVFTSFDFFYIFTITTFIPVLNSVLFTNKASVNITTRFDYLYYCKNPKFSDSQALANSADPDQTPPRGAV